MFTNKGIVRNILQDNFFSKYILKIIENDYDLEAKNGYHKLHFTRLKEVIIKENLINQRGAKPEQIVKDYLEFRMLKFPRSK